MPIDFGKFKKPQEIKKEPVRIEKPKIIPKIPKIDNGPGSSEELSINLMLEDLAKTSEFKRLMYKALIGKVHRGSSDNLDKELSKAITSFRANN